MKKSRILVVGRAAGGLAGLLGTAACLWYTGRRLLIKKRQKSEERQKNDGLSRWEEKRIGIVLLYDPAAMVLREPVHRRAPFAVLEFRVLEDTGDAAIGAAVTVQVHDCSTEEPTSLQEYVDKSLRTLEEMEDEELDVDMFEETLLGNLPAIQFCYHCADGDGVKRKVFSVVAQLGSAVYSLSYSSPVTSFSSLEKVKGFASRIRIRPPSPSDSSLIFTDPKYGVSLQVPASQYHVESTPATGGRSWREVVQFSTVEKPEGGASILRLDAEPADLPVINFENPTVSPPRERKQKSALAGIRYAAQLYRQQVLQESPSAEDVILWARLDVDEENDNCLIPDEKGRRVSTDIVNSLTRSLVLKGPEELDAVAFSYYKSCSGNTSLCFIVYMWLRKGDLFVLSSVCHSDERVNVARSVYNVANTMRCDEKHGQTSSLKYYSPTHGFSLLLPTEMRAFEPFIGDPYVVFCLPSGSRLLGKEPDRKGRLLREFYVQVRVLDTLDTDVPHDPNECLQEILVAEMGELATQEATVHHSTVTQLASYPALEVVFTADSQPYKGCLELAMPQPSRATVLRMITIKQGLKFVLEFVASVTYFPHLADSVFADMISSFTFDEALVSTCLMSGHGQEAVVRILEWKGPSSDATVCKISIGSQLKCTPQGSPSNIGMTWGAHEMRLPCTDTNDNILFSVLNGSNEIATITTRLSDIPTIHNNESTQLMLSSNDIDVGTLTFQIHVEGAAPQGKFFDSANVPQPTAPPMPGPPPAPTNPRPPPPQHQVQVPPGAPQAPPGAPQATAPPPQAMAPQYIPGHSMPIHQPQITPCQIKTNPDGPLRYTGAPPVPPPAINAPTPTEKWRAHIDKINTDKEKREAEYSAKKQQPPPKGFMSKLSSGISAAAHHTTSFVKETTHSAEVALRKHDDEELLALWRSVFSSLAERDTLECGYKCSYVNGGEKQIQGTLFISTKHFSFTPSRSAGQPQPSFFDSLTNIVTYHSAVSNSQPCIQIYTLNGYVYQFGQFTDDIKRTVGTLWGTVNGSSFDCLMVYLDRMWRQATHVPVPGFTYAQ